MNIIKDLYNYRELLKTNITKDIGGKYKHSFLGILWSFINPLLQITVYAFVFQVILRSNIENYAVYLCCGLIPWQYFSNIVLRGAAVMVDNGNIIKKVYFPREIIPISVVTAETINFLIATLIIIGFTVIGGVGISKYILFYPIILGVQYVIILAFSFIVSGICVYFRDLQHFIGIILQLLFYATPIVYSQDAIPREYQWILKYNPMTYIINAYRDIFYYQRLMDFMPLIILFFIGVLACIGNYKIFNKLQKGFAEQL